jgi:GT2 family glycosyltransferase
VPNMQTLSASVVITTKNRKEELRAALRSAIEQTAQPEVVVIDDGSTDGTAEMVRAEFPTVRLERSETSFGLIVQRNRAARLAGGDIIFSIDDDAVFVSPHTVAQTLQEFDPPRVGAVAIPYLEPRKSPVVHQQAPASEGMFITDDFIGTAHAVRKDVFLQLGGYREYLVHQGEEMDFCIRMLATGRVVRLGRADVIHHLESPRRDFRRMDYYGRRNDIIFAWLNVPQPSLIIFFPMLVLNATMYSLKTRGTLIKLHGIGAGLLGVWLYRKHRAPVDRRIFKLFRWLRKRGLARLVDVESQLPDAPRAIFKNNPLKPT